MAMSTFQKVTLATCLVLCVSLLLPKMLLSRGRKDAAERPEGSGHFPPMIHRHMAPEGRGQRGAATGFSKAHNPEAIARAKGAGTGAGVGGKSNLAGQIIPVYGFGILLYIVYILFKITSKGSSKPSEARFPSVHSENMKRKITDFELAQLQEKLRETELVMENIVSNAHNSPDRLKGVMVDQEESLLQQLTQITRMMQEGQMVEEVPPEKKAQDDWGDDPEERPSHWERSYCCCQESRSTQQESGAEGDRAAEDVTGGDRTAGEDASKDTVREPDSAALDEEDVSPQSDLMGTEGCVDEDREGAAPLDLGVTGEGLDGVLKEMELTLRVTSVVEQKKMEDPMALAADTETSCSSVRRRNKRRRAKKVTH
ncbi:protein RIC-3b [Pholidichthys leucotaenia]